MSRENALKTVERIISSRVTDAKELGITITRDEAKAEIRDLINLFKKS